MAKDNTLAYRIYKGLGLNYKSCYVLARDGTVVEAQEPMLFAVGWTVVKLRQRALGKGYSMALQHGMRKLPGASPLGTEWIPRPIGRAR